MTNKIMIDIPTNNLLNIFVENFNKIYTNIDLSQKTVLKSFAPTIFKKWYYSSLIDDTMLSPANIINAHYQDIVDEDTVIGVSLSNTKGNRSLMKDGFYFHTYSVNDHPVIKDLKILIDCCQPDADLCSSQYSFSDELTNIILKKLSMKDPFYLKFVLMIAFELKLIIKMTSIYSSKIQPTDHCEEFFELSTDIALRKIFDATMDISIRKLSQDVHLSYEVIHKKLMMSFLKKPVHIDDIFKKLYSLVGIDVEKIWKLFDSESLSDEDSVLLSSTFYLGVILDKWFITPFGSYLKLIQPVYTEPYRFQDEINAICRNIVTNSDISMDLFSPCTSYDITPIGRALLFKKDSQKQIQKLDSDLSLEKVLALYQNNQLLFGETTVFETIYVLKIKHKNDKRLWKVIEVPHSFTLDKLTDEIVALFSLYNHVNYRFQLPSGVKYLFPNLVHNIGESYSLTLDDLGLSEKDKILFQTDINKNLSLEIVVIKKETSKYGILYPRVTKQSKFIEDDNDYNL